MVYKDLAFGIFLFIVSAIGFYSFSDLDQGKNIIYGPAFFPRLLLFFLLIGSLVFLVKSVWLIAKRQAPLLKTALPDKKLILPIILFWISILGYVILFIQFGFIISTLIFLFVAQRIFGRKGILQITVISLLVAFVTYYALTLLFQVPMV